MPSPRLMPIPTTDTTAMDTTVLDTAPTDTVLATTDTVLATTVATMARGPLMLSPPLLLSPRLMPIPTTDTTAWATTVLDTLVPTDTVLDTTDTPVLATTDTVLATTARGPLSPPPSPPLTLMPRLIPTTDTTAMDTDTVSDTTVLDTAPTDTVLATTATTDKCPAIHPKTSLGITSSSSEKWIAQFGLTPTSATSFSATRLAQARNGEQEAKENQNVMIRRIKKLKSK